MYPLEISPFHRLLKVIYHTSVSTYGMDWNSDGALYVQIFQLSKPSLT